MPQTQSYPKASTLREKLKQTSDNRGHKQSSDPQIASASGHSANSVFRPAICLMLTIAGY
jgi:hypothetical protein